MFTLNSPMPPVWLMYPNISQYSIGWKMGYGEGYEFALLDWLKTLSVEDRKVYDQMFPRPIFWKDHNYVSIDDQQDNDNYQEEDEQEIWHNDAFIQYWSDNGTMKYERSMFQGKNLRQKAILFWKSNASSHIIDKSCLSQWQISPFSIDIEDYICMEQYMMATKAKLFDDKESKDLIMASKDPKEMQTLGKQVKNFDQATWDKFKYTIVLTGNYYKFAQNKTMRDFLLSTKNSILIEASPLDSIWGVGLDESNPLIYDVNTWRGTNLLGFALMELRDELSRLYKYYDIIDWSKLEKE